MKKHQADILQCEPSTSASSTSLFLSTGQPLARTGFTLIEVMVIVVIIGLLAVMAMPAFQKARIGTQNTRIINDLRVFRQGFANYSFENGQWPSETGPGVMPAEMDGYVTQSTFEARTVVGGRYDWNFQDSVYGASIAMVDTFMDSGQAQVIDEKIDDGNLATGAFRENSGSFVLVLEE